MHNSIQFVQIENRSSPIRKFVIGFVLVVCRLDELNFRVEFECVACLVINVDLLTCGRSCRRVHVRVEELAIVSASVSSAVSAAEKTNGKWFSPHDASLVSFDQVG